MPILWIGSSGRHGSGLGCLFSEPAGRHLALPSRIVSLLGCIAPTCVPHSAWDVQCVLQELCFFRPDHVGGGQEAGKRRGRPVEWLVYPDCVTTAALHQGWPVWSVRCTFRYFTERRQVHSANACGEAGAVLFFFLPTRLGRSWVPHHHTCLAQRLCCAGRCAFGGSPFKASLLEPEFLHPASSVSPMASLPVGIGREGDTASWQA